ncbi:MAG: metal-dependent transcriptional regulator [Desulfobulbaceae bacterium]|nr:metal-dependent transcriptional regulator [Desulfobulbaceae bacterium]HIJ77818.1 metal-dependent transcriptional regulator [Deltaproteobacteria bacterium]
MDEKYEEILEAIWAASENKKYSLEAIKKRCAVNFVDADLAELESTGMIVREQEKIIFSDEGKKLAEGIMRRHRLAEVLVTSILKLKSTEMEKIACKVEHYLHPEVEESICILLGHPEICPDGKPIPKGKCCTHGLQVVNNTVISLDQLVPGQSGKITYIKPGSHSNLHHLISLGLSPGVVVTVHRKSPAFCIKFEQTELALDVEIVKNIFVWKLDN